MGRCLTSLVISKLQIKTTMRYTRQLLKGIHFFKNLTIRNAFDHRNFNLLLKEIQNGTALWKPLCQFLLKLNMHLQYGSAFSLLGIYPSEFKT